MIFTQFAERRIFIHLFRYDHGGLSFVLSFLVTPVTTSCLSFETDFIDALLEATVGCLMHQQSATGEEGAEMCGNKLTVTSPIEFFIEVCLESLSSIVPEPYTKSVHTNFPSGRQLLPQISRGGNWPITYEPELLRGQADSRYVVWIVVQDPPH